MGDKRIRSCCWQPAAQRVVWGVVVLAAGTAAAFAQGRAPLPDDAALSTAQGLLRAVYGKEYDEAETSDEKTALAKKMLAQAAKTKGDPASHFVLLRAARDMAVAAGDVETAFEAVRQIAATYDVDGMEMKWEMGRKSGFPSSRTWGRSRRSSRSAGVAVLHIFVGSRSRLRPRSP